MASYSDSEEEGTTAAYSWSTDGLEAAVEESTGLLHPTPSTDVYMSTVNVFNLYIEGFILFSGLIGNILILAVFTKRKIKGSSCIFIRALSVTDFLILSICLSTHWINYNFNKTGKAVPLCKTILVLTTGLFDFAAWVIVSMTIDRFISVTHPLRVKAWCTKERALVVLLVNAIVSCLKNGYVVILGGFQYNKHLGTMVCTLMYDKEKLSDRVYPWLDLVWGSLLPLVLIVTLNTGIIHGLHTSPQIKGASNVSQRSRRDRQITISLLLISFFFLLLTLPRKAFLLYFNHTDAPPATARALHSAKYQLAHAITSKMWFFNCAINICLFSLSAPSFRKEVVRVLLCRRGTRVAPLDGGTGSSRRGNGETSQPATTALQINRTTVQQLTPAFNQQITPMTDEPANHPNDHLPNHPDDQPANHPDD